MQAFVALVRRELGSFFKAWTGYIIIAGVAFLLGVGFWSMLEAFNSESTPVPLTRLFFQAPYFWAILVFVAPLITMRSFAQEKSSGTYETLMTTPVGDAQVVLAKFTSALLFYLLAWLPLLVCIGVVRYYSKDPNSLDLVTLSTTYLGVGLIGCVYLSIGIFASTMTRSQIISFMISLAFGLTLLAMSVLSSTFATKTGWLAQVIAHMALVEYMHDFAQGIVDSRPVILYLTLTMFFLFLSWKSVESRRWK